MTTDLAALIEQVQESAVSDEPLDRVAAAMSAKADLDEVADELIGHFVDAARAAGCSWAEIGSAMGVTKQAAQQRHTSERHHRGDRGGPAFRRFTPRARTSVREANAAADDLRHGYVGTEHLLLGVLAVPQSIGAKALESLGLTREHVVAALSPGEGERRRRRRSPFTPLAKRALDESLKEALQLGHSYVGTEHLVLALRRVEDGLAAKVMKDSGIEAESLQSEIIRLLAAA